MREAQIKTMMGVANRGMVVTLDLVEKNNIHPAKKEEVGNRLAYWALAKTYNFRKIAYSGPVFKKMEIKENGTAELSFDYCDLGLSSFGKPLEGFEIAGEDRQFYPATAVIVRDKRGVITVKSDKFEKLVSVRYAFQS